MIEVIIINFGVKVPPLSEAEHILPNVKPCNEKGDVSI
jgi:hypothetical protein